MSRGRLLRTRRPAAAPTGERPSPADVPPLGTVLVVGLDADPTGGGGPLLDLLDRVRADHPRVELHVMLLHGGPLVHRFHQLGATTVADWYDRQYDRRRGAAIVANRRRQQRLAHLIDRLASATLARRLPRVAADVVLVSGWEALAAGPLGAHRSVPRVVLLPTGMTPPKPDGGPAEDDGRRRAGCALRRAAVIVVGTREARAEVAAAGGDAERVTVPLRIGEAQAAADERKALGEADDNPAELVWDALERAVQP